MKTYYYKVIHGFGSDDYISITADELPRAAKAQVTGQVVFFKEGSIGGNLIQKIVPDFGRMLGLNRGYKLSGEDYKLLSEEVTNNAFTLLEDTKLSITGGSRGELSGPTNSLIGVVTKKLTGKNKNND